MVEESKFSQQQKSYSETFNAWQAVAEHLGIDYEKYQMYMVITPINTSSSWNQYYGPFSNVKDAEDWANKALFSPWTISQLKRPWKPME